jgi:hypothetical protein
MKPPATARASGPASASASASASVPASAPSSAVAIGLAAAFALSLYFAPALLAQAGWSVFDSSEAVPASSGVSFSVRYPPGFIKGAVRPMPSRSGVTGSFALSFRRPDRAAGTLVSLFSAALVLDPEMKRLVSGLGREAFFGIMGDAIAARLSSAEGAEAAIDGISLFRYRGLQAADIRYSGTERLPAGDVYAMYGTERTVAKEGCHVRLTCAFTMPQADAAGTACTSASHPASGPVCAPFLDSLEFKG